MTQAALGADVKVQTLEGEETLAIPPGTQSGKIFRLRNRGVPHLGHRGRGDLIIEVVVDTPTHLDREQERLLRELAKVRGEEISQHSEGLRSRLRSAFG
jgi:molecular chaperone DnaJ